MSNLPSDTPRLPKWPFLVGDAALLGIALVLALRSSLPLSTGLIFAITGCVALAAILGAIPFLAEYASQQDEALDERQRSLEALTRTVANSAEQISVAANSLHELSELSREQLREAKAIPEKLTAELESLQNEQNESLTSENKSLQKELKTLRNSESQKLTELTEKIQVAIDEIGQLKLAAVAPPPAPKKARSAKAKPDPISPPAEPEPTPVDEAPAETIAEPLPVETTTEPVKEVTEAAAPEETPVEDVQVEAVSSNEAPAPVPVSEEAIPEDSLSEEAPEPVTEAAKPILESPMPATEESPEAAPPAEEKEEEADPELSLGESEPPKADHRISPDGITRLLVSAYIGIGNRLFVRGKGAGLSEDKGVPLQFVSIGKWQWESSEVDSELKVKLYKNDEIECTALGEITIDPGSQSQVSATF